MEKVKIEVNVEVEVERICCIVRGEVDVILVKYLVEVKGVQFVLEVKVKGYE